MWLGWVLRVGFESGYPLSCKAQFPNKQPLFLFLSAQIFFICSELHVNRPTEYARCQAWMPLLHVMSVRLTHVVACISRWCLSFLFVFHNRKEFFFQNLLEQRTQDTKKKMYGHQLYFYKLVNKKSKNKIEKAISFTMTSKQIRREHIRL